MAAGSVPGFYRRFRATFGGRPCMPGQSVFLALCRNEKAPTQNAGASWNGPDEAPGLEGTQIREPIFTAVSAMRLEKPHSLSYQDRTEHSVPSMTLV